MILKSLLLSLVLLSSSLFSFETRAPICGQSADEKEQAHLTFTHLGSFSVDSKYGGLSGQVCVGFNAATKLAESFYYYDENGGSAFFPIEEFKAFDVVIVHKRDIGGVAGKMIKNTALLTVKVIDESLEAGKTNYKISFKFLKNLTKGFKGAIIKDLVLDASINHRTNLVETTYTSLNEDTLGQKFVTDQIVLKIGKSFVIYSIDLSKKGEHVHRIKTFDLERGKRIYRPAEEEEDEEDAPEDGINK